MAIKKFLSESGFKHFVEKVIGKTDISSIGDGTIKDAVSSLNESLSDVNNNLTQCPTKINKTYSATNQSFEYEINNLSLIFITYGSYQTADFYVCRCITRSAYALVPIYKTGNIDDTYDINLDIESKILTITSKKAWLQVNVISL